MMMTKQRRAIRTLRGWAIHVLQEAGAIHECDEHGWAKDRADPHAREDALNIARQEPPGGLPPDQATAEILDVLDSIGDNSLNATKRPAPPPSRRRRHASC